MQAFQLASSAFQVVGDIVGGNQADKVATRNAALLNERAGQSLQATAARELQLRDRNRQTLDAQRVAMLQNGIDPGSGSALVGTEQQIRDAEMDALQLRYEGLLQARVLRMEADMTRWQGKAAKRQSRLSAAGKLIGAGGDYLRASGFGAKGPGFSGQQPPAPVETRIPFPNPYAR